LFEIGAKHESARKRLGCVIQVLNHVSFKEVRLRERGIKKNIVHSASHKHKIQYMMAASVRPQKVYIRKIIR
jgi:hypothetical protein